MDRAKEICRRRNEWEQSTVRRQLKIINLRTPSLEKGLRQETERLRHYEESLASFSSHAPLKASRFSTPVPSRQRPNTWNVPRNSSSQNPSNSRPFSERQTHTLVDDTKGKQDTISMLSRRSELVTRALHSLYTRSIERRWTEGNKSLLEILSNESQEQIMKARVVLRGTETGAMFDAILGFQDNQHSTISSSEAADNTPSAGNYANVNRTSPDRTHNSNDKYDNCDTDIEKHAILVTNGHMYSETDFAWERSHLDKEEHKELSPDLDAMKLMPNILPEDLESEFVSSMVVNPSVDHKLDDRMGLRWTDIFRTPELWKQNVTSHIFKRRKPKPKSLVTLTARYRKTMIK
ncbi:hypothetical protein CHS0354_014588 [Potamilus streckersoni]|uniref:Uncharacterized protein n=1 Tax=Potamilus streckersoni TaxID=2493646 RepID=A0AAE0RNN4_9BIVA|nr:hypothetical protein CHS0354_014588 [Potamilus streckersoni]